MNAFVLVVSTVRFAAAHVVIVRGIVGVDIAKFYTCLQFVSLGQRPGIVGLERIDIDRAGQIAGQDRLVEQDIVRREGLVIEMPGC